MGRQIAALLVNAGLKVHLLDLGTADDPTSLARQAIVDLPGMRPAPLLRSADTQHIQPGALHDAGDALAGAEWVIEAVVEDLAIKRSVLDLIEAQAHPDAVVSTNTSGLPIASLCEGRSDSFCRRFLGVHFFNPPRAMPLVEVIPGAATDPQIVASCREWIESGLGKRVVVCRDTPNFIANRLGVFSLMDALHRMVDHGLSVDAVDAVTGSLLGRPRSATLRLCDLIGLDTLSHVARTVYDGITDDPWRETFSPPEFMLAMIAAGQLGAKSGSGFYAKQGKEIQCLDLASGGYRSREKIRLNLPTRGTLGERLDALWSADDALAQFAREHVAVTIAYAASCARQVADRLEDVDRAVMWGFNWEAGPLEMIDLIGPQRLLDTLEASSQPVPGLISDLVRGGGTVYRTSAQSVDVIASDGSYVPQISSGPLGDADYLDTLDVLEQGDGARLYAAGNGVGVLEFHTGPLNILGPEPLHMATAVVNSGQLQSVVLCGAGEHFSAGADLQLLLRLIEGERWQELEEYLVLFQSTTALMRFAPIPVVLAAGGLALGGGCEFSLTCATRVLAAELRTGLVEAKVGLIPGAGGCKEVVRRFGPDINAVFETLRTGAMSDNARQAQDWGLVDASDMIRMDGHRVVQHAVEEAQRLAAGWQAPAVLDLPTAGSKGLSRLVAELEQAHIAGQITPHDVVVGQALAHVLCGGGEPLVSQQRLLDLEREQFLALCATAATRERIVHMLDTGKPLSN
ncbi:MAG: hypothetical protein HOM68_24815 [Gemmatimonadetes bacterium]|jgi:3-hydroxyacyl-CoA dehydrogenase|nr:hypothetical protein [Gemmatimonadota bacterium]MBT5146609.1 hypothetical protein [Gemmatimonadota bacterium]MBT5587259.1 hypothetical protein [Gemmatimonadota bacterium]MBT5961327.1 hypothetical protein [Gemmatimonadota bacterium]MBT6628093.1 hypothetical protein [Gemmatimonadota bacterium]